jgi:hypothetical protein
METSRRSRARPISAALKSCTASVTNSHPAGYTTTNVKVAVSTIAYYLSGAAPGYRVVVNVTVVSGHQANNCSTSFTPKS